MVHCGYEASAVDDTFSSFKGFWKTVKHTLLPQKPAEDNGEPQTDAAARAA